MTTTVKQKMKSKTKIKALSDKPAFRVYSWHGSSRRKPYYLQVRFGGEYVRLFYYETEEIARRVAAFALEHAPRFESSDDLKGFRLLIRAWAVKQGYTSYVPFGVHAFPLEMKPAIEALIELQNAIALKELQKVQDTIRLRGDDTQKVPKGVWTLKDNEMLRRLSMTHTDAEVSPILNRSIGAIEKQRKKLNIQKSRNLSHLFEAMETLEEGE